MSKEEKPMSYCKFIRCGTDPERILEDTDYQGCGIAWSGETCWTLYSDIEDETPTDKFIAYEIHLEEVRFNNERRR